MKVKAKTKTRKPGSRRKLVRVAKKPQAKPPKIREPREVIVSFRLRNSEALLLQKDLDKRPIAGVKSLKQFARKLTIDHARGRTVYVNDVDRSIDPDARERLNLEPPNCEMTDVQFLRNLREFISTEDNWNRLRLFLLQAGWPPEIAEKYASARTSEERLGWAQAVLSRMITK